MSKEDDKIEEANLQQAVCPNLKTTVFNMPQQSQLQQRDRGID
jgi:hypothetical protein